MKLKSSTMEDQICLSDSRRNRKVMFMAKKEDALAVVDGKKKLVAEVVLYSGDKRISEALEKTQKLSDADFYKLGQKTVPSARALQWLANRKNIKTRIVDIKSEGNYCRAIVAGWIGDNPVPESNQIYKEATVEMMFELEMADKVLDMIRKFSLKRGTDWEVDEHGLPLLTNPAMLAKQMNELIRMRKFALRTVVTKAERIIHSKLADVEWRDQDELNDEQAEVETVSGQRMEEGKDKPKTKSKPEPEVKDAEVVEEEPEPEEEDVGFEIKDGVIEEDMTPRGAFQALDDYMFDSQQEDVFKALVLEFIPNFFEDSYDRFQVPESACMAIIKKATGFKLKLVEKTPTCTKKACKEKLTEPEAEEHKGLCREHFQEAINE